MRSSVDELSTSDHNFVKNAGTVDSVIASPVEVNILLQSQYNSKQNQTPLQNNTI
jgi:hypothetical protein